MDEEKLELVGKELLSVIVNQDPPLTNAERGALVARLLFETFPWGASKQGFEHWEKVCEDLTDLGKWVYVASPPNGVRAIGAN
jgi:hypothetical protein